MSYHDSNTFDDSFPPAAPVSPRIPRYVSKEAQLNKLRRRLEVEGVTQDVNMVRCRKCVDKTVIL